MAGHPELSLSGVEAFAGILGAGRTGAELARVDKFLRHVTACAERLDRDGLLTRSAEILLSAGGSFYFDRVAGIFRAASLSRPPRVVLRSGCYAFHDHGDHPGAPLLLGADGRTELVPALELWSEVVSVPEPGLAIAGFGRREAPYDAALPVVLGRLADADGTLGPLPGVTVTALNDLITGGGTGIGRQFTESLAGAGAHVVICGRRAEPLAQAVAEITAAGGAATAVTADVSSEDDRRRLAAAAGPVDVLVNNLVTGNPFFYPDFDWDSPAYVTSKHALIGLSKYLAVRTGDTGVTVNTISPGMFPFTEANAARISAESMRRLREFTPARRPGDIEDLASALLFLASPDSSFVTGQNIVVDGGWTLW